MHAIFYHPTADFTVWQNRFAESLPDLTLSNYKALSKTESNLSSNEFNFEEIEYALVWAPPSDMLRHFKNLKAVFVLGAGVDAILTQEQNFPGTLPTGVPIIRIEDGGMAKQMCDYALFTVYRYFRRFDEYAKLQAEKKWQPLANFTVDEFTIGVMGAGILGETVACKFAAEGFTVSCWSRSRKQIEGVKSFAGKEELDDFLKSTKMLINLLPKTAETVGLINKTALQTLPKGAYLLNLARGAHVIENDLLEMLNNGHIAGATLDVFQQEPLPVESDFWLHPNITITPHNAAVTNLPEAVTQISENILRLIKGEKPSGQIDLIRGY